jgi:hypothetical protein
MKLRILALSLAISMLTLTLLPTAGLAASAALYVSPASGTVPVGNIIPVQIRVNSGSDPVNAIQANISYNATALAYQSVDSTNSAFSLVANVQTSSGSVKLARARAGGESPISGDHLFATVMFKALTTAGTASVVIASGSAVVRSTDSVDILAGAPAASGAKASMAGAPTPKAYTTVAAAQASIAASTTPAPTTTTKPTTAGGQSSATPVPTAAASATGDTQVLAWNSPYVLGGAALLLVMVVAVILAYWHRRNLLATPVVSAAPITPVMPDAPVMPAATVQPTTINPIVSPTEPATVIQPEVPGETKPGSDQIEG